MWIFQINEFYPFTYRKYFLKHFKKQSQAYRKVDTQYIHHDFSPKPLENKLLIWYPNTDISYKTWAFSTIKIRKLSDILLPYGPQIPFNFANSSNMSFTTIGSSSELHTVLHIVQITHCCHCLFSFFQSGTVPQIFSFMTGNFKNYQMLFYRRSPKIWICLIFLQD